MITKEREVGEKKVLIKTLRLVTPELAIKLGIETETPVFVSQAQNRSEECKVEGCGVEYKPLIYQVGYLVKAHHFHPNLRGGIYYRDYPDILAAGGYFNSVIQSNDAWVAFVEPIGSTSFDPSAQYPIAEQVMITKIRAFCNKLYCMNKAKSTELFEGLVVSPADHKDFLEPLCNTERHPEYSSLVRYQFKITEDGEVLFSQYGRE